MADEQIGLLLNMGSDEAGLLLEQTECALYRRIQWKMVKLVREYGVQLPLNCLQFMHCENRLHRPSTVWRHGAEVILRGGN